MKDLEQKISFKEKDGKLVHMFSILAEEIADKLENDYVERNGKTIPRKTHTTQFRQFYEKILELNDKAQGLSNEEFQLKILPFVKLLNSKVQYSFTRSHCGLNFLNLMQVSIKAVNSAEELHNFKYFLEAIIGYMPKK